MKQQQQQQLIAPQNISYFANGILNHQQRETNFSYSIIYKVDCVVINDREQVTQTTNRS